MTKGSKPMIQNPFYRAPSKIELESAPESYLNEEIPLGLKSGSMPEIENPNYDTAPKFESQGDHLPASGNPHQAKSKKKRSTFIRIIFLVGIILVGSSAFISIGISLWTISKITSHISELEVIKIELNDSKTEQIMKFQAFKNNISEQIKELQASNNNISVEFQVSKINLSDQIMEFKNASDGIPILEKRITQLQDFVDAANKFVMLQAIWIQKLTKLFRMNNTIRVPMSCS